MTEQLPALQAKALDLRNYLQGSNVKNQLAAALPKWLSPDRLLRIVFTSAMKNPKLLDCTRESILSSVMQCAQLGLEPILGRAYLIPYQNSKKSGDTWLKVLECQMQIGYQGFVDIARRTNMISDVWGACVYENDEFDLQFGMNRRLHHRPWYMDREKAKDGQPGECLGAYIIWKFKDETQHPEFMPIFEIHRRRAVSQSFQFAEFGDQKKGGGKKDSVWHKWPEEMNLKTVIKHSSKLIPASIEFMQAIEVDSDSEFGRAQIGIFDGALTLPDATPRLPDPGTPPVGGPDLISRFKSTIGPELAADPRMDDFVKGSAKANGATVGATLQEAIDNVEAFTEAFKRWKSMQEGKTVAPPAEKPPAEKTENQGQNGKAYGSGVDYNDFIKEWIRLHDVGFDKYISANLARFDQFPPWVKKKAQDKAEKFGLAWPSDSPSNETSQESTGGTTSEMVDTTSQGEIVQPGANQRVDITQSDEFNELCMLQDRYPDIYSKIVGKITLKTIPQITTAINLLNEAVKEEAGAAGGVAAGESFFDQDEPDDIPY